MITALKGKITRAQNHTCMTMLTMEFVSPQITIIPKKYFTNEVLDYFCSKVCKTCNKHVKYDKVL